MLSTQARRYLVRRFDLFDEDEIHADGEEIHCHGLTPGTGMLREFFIGFESEIERNARQLAGEQSAWEY